MDPATHPLAMDPAYQYQPPSSHPSQQYVEEPLPYDPTSRPPPPARGPPTPTPGHQYPFEVPPAHDVPRPIDAVAMQGGLGTGGAPSMIYGYVPGQQVLSSTELFIRDEMTGEALQAVRPGCRGVVLGPPTTDDPRRLAVIFDDYVSEPLNVLPHEIHVGREPFDPQSRSIEDQLARLIWEGRDLLALAKPDPLSPEEEVHVLQTAAHDSPIRFLAQLPPEEAAMAARGEIPLGPMALSVVPTKPKPKLIDPIYRARLLAFFERYNPHRLPSVPALLQEHSGNEEELIQALIKKYGPEPMHVQTSLPSGWSQVQSSKGHVFYRHANGTKQWSRPV